MTLVRGSVGGATTVEPVPTSGRSAGFDQRPDYEHVNNLLFVKW